MKTAAPQLVGFLVAALTLVQGGCATKACALHAGDAIGQLARASQPRRVRLAFDGPPYRVRVDYADGSSAGVTWSPGSSTSPGRVVWGDPHPAAAAWFEVPAGRAAGGWSWSDGELTFAREGSVTASVRLGRPASAWPPVVLFALVVPAAVAVDLATLPLQALLLLFVLHFGFI